MQRKSIKRNRRRFLKQAGLMAGAGALLAMTPRHATDEKATGREGRGYRLTAHIRSYYQKAGW